MNFTTEYRSKYHECRTCEQTLASVKTRPWRGSRVSFEQGRRARRHRSRSEAPRLRNASGFGMTSRIGGSLE